MPPKPLRLVLLVPLWIALALTGAVFAPLLFAVGGAASAITRNRQPLRLVHFVLLYLRREAATLVACAGLWLLSGFGWRIASPWSQRTHYRLLNWLLGGILQPVLDSLRITVSLEPTPEAERALRRRDRPLILLSRHAGPGDSFLILTTLMQEFGRRPRVVLKATLALDPCIDILCNRLPNALIDTSNAEACERQIASLASGMEGADTLVLFPEGGNYTPERRHRAILSLWRKGRGRQAARAERMEHVMPPKPLGALTALQANPGADVVFAAHTGLGHEAFPMELWRNPPTDRTVRMRMWLAPADDRPQSPEGQTEWLFDWWKTLDDWIDDTGEPVPVPDG